MLLRKIILNILTLIFKQTTEIPIGNNCSAEIADTTSSVLKFNNIKIASYIKYFRYIDDILINNFCSECVNLGDIYGNKHSITLDKPSTFVNFLDLTIKADKDKKFTTIN